MTTTEVKPTGLTQVQKFVRQLKRNRINRCYHTKCFNIDNVYEAGLIQSDKVASFDQVVIDKSKNESIEFYGFDKDGNHLQFSLSIASLYPNAKRPLDESKWRLAKVKLLMLSAKEQLNYTYEATQLVDYDIKRSNCNSHESKRVYKVGSLSLEINCEHSLARILFNGSMKCYNNLTNEEKLISARISISTHPTSDKFDFQYKFSHTYLAKLVHNCQPKDKAEIEKLCKIVLADRIDQPMMLQVQLLLLGDDSRRPDPFILWGAKSKNFIDLNEERREASEALESLVLWVECGHVIELCRPMNSRYRNLVFGWVHSSFDYTGYLNDIKLKRKTGDNDSSLVEMNWHELESFSQLADEHEIHLTSYKSKSYRIKRVAQNDNETGKTNLIKLEVNNFAGYATIREVDVHKQFSSAQACLLTLRIDDSKFSPFLASESLLGGKGNSLIELSKQTAQLRNLLNDEFGISVPKGLIVTCCAYQLWYQSNPIIRNTICELDNTRRTLAARSIYTNPVDDKHVSLAQFQQILREQCLKTRLVINSCPLPPALRRHLRAELMSMFGENKLRNRDDESGDQNQRKTFAVRSSAVGEDSTETSAAGQMRTILDVVGFDSICHAIVECWSSQFQLEAVTYKTQNGLDFNLPMAVVVQELVNCKAAGVGATCDPLSGNKNELQILANPGMGEGVVSGKQTDTVRVPLTALTWNPELELHEGQLTLESTRDQITKQSDTQTGCCLSDEQIISLANLLLALRRSSDIKDREIEWGITDLGDESAASSSSSSSSASNSSPRRASFQIHMLQSRPLTHLHKLNAHEIDHELDYGISSHMDLVSRANLGEVMPATLCPMNSTYFHPVVSSLQSLKPYESHHTKCAFVSETFSFYGQMVAMVMTYSDSVARFMGLQGNDVKERHAMLDSMLGTDLAGRNLDGRLESFFDERRNPNSPKRLIRFNLLTLIGLDSKAFDLISGYMNRQAARAKLHENLQPIEELIEKIEKQKPGDDLTSSLVSKDIEKLRKAILNQTSLLSSGWYFHIRSTLVSMALNTICLKLLSQQPVYTGCEMTSPEVQTDFSILMQGDGSSSSSEKVTVGGDMSKLLNQITEALFQEGLIERVKSMDSRQLYQFLSTSTSKSAQSFREFLETNGHRAYKEFDFATLTWSDDPSCLLKMLAQRIRGSKDADFERAREEAKNRLKQQEVSYREVVAKIEKARFFLTSVSLPRARNAVIRRERSKSFLIKMIHKYRKAFRHLGALLCLQGKLPSADLVFWLAISELDFVINCGDEQRGDLSRLLYKARRRQQRSRVYNQVTFPRPTMDFSEMVELLQDVSLGPRPGDHSEPAPRQSGDESERNRDDENRVSGIISCTGCVTGRACVVASIEDMDQVEPNDILITYSIDISWSIYFFTLAGIVTEVGGIVSHGAVLAREYGIPTLCTAMGACSKFKTGQIVTLDATHGVCYLTESASEQATASGSRDTGE